MAQRDWDEAVVDQSWQDIDVKGVLVPALARAAHVTHLM